MGTGLIWLPTRTVADSHEHGNWTQVPDYRSDLLTFEQDSDPWVRQYQTSCCTQVRSNSLLWSLLLHTLRRNLVCTALPPKPQFSNCRPPYRLTHFAAILISEVLMSQWLCPFSRDHKWTRVVCPDGAGRSINSIFIPFSSFIPLSYSLFLSFVSLFVTQVHSLHSGNCGIRASWPNNSNFVRWILSSFISVALNMIQLWWWMMNKEALGRRRW